MKSEHDFCGKINIFSVKSSFLQEKLAKELISRKMWSRFLILFYTAQSDFYRNSLSHFFWQKFRETNTFTKQITKLLLNWRESKFFILLCAQCGKTRNYLSLEKISWNQLFSNFFSKNDVAFTKFLSKMCESKFLEFHTV